MAEQASGSASTKELLRMTADVVAAYVSKNPLPANDLPSIINTVHLSLAGLDSDKQSVGDGALKPAVPVRKSVTPDFLVCLEDGKKLKMLKRHLRTAYNLSPDEYRAKWQLGPDYPMVAPNYAKRRSQFAKDIGLGRKSGRRKARA